MNYDSFIDEITSHYFQEQPLVVFSYPNDSKVQAWLQDNDVLHETKDFNEEGFVFAPFDLQSHPIILLKDKVRMLESHGPEGVGETFQRTKAEDESVAEAYQDLIKKAVHSIHSTELSKVVLSRSIKVDKPDVSPIVLFERLFKKYQNTFTYLWYHPKVGLWLGATPEKLLSLKRNRLETVSLAGTLPIDSDQDWSSKEIEEQQLVTDFIVSELQPVSLDVRHDQPETSYAGKLRHLKTEITANLKTDHLSLREVIYKLHPTPAVCGFPKDLAKQFIDENEPYDRRFYTGFLGVINETVSTSRSNNKHNTENKVFRSVIKSSQLYVNLRCMELQNKSLIVFVGGGIVAGSEPVQEWLETVEKSGTMMSII